MKYQGGASMMSGWRPKHKQGPSRMMLLVLLVLLIGVVLTLLNVYQLHQMKEEHTFHTRDHGAVVEGITGRGARIAPVVWIHGSHMETGYLDHVKAVFTRLGFTLSTAHDDWDVLWVHSYPFTTMSSIMSRLLPHQKVNHFPGSGHITNKMLLATAESKAIPKAFKMPQEREKFKEYVKTYPEKLWVQKSNNHRGIKIKNVEELDFSGSDSFVQEYIAKPLLVAGRKFDIGVYTIMTSVDPLRIYVVDDEALIRFCPQVYYPFDRTNVDKYVIGDNYMPMWKMKALQDMYEKKGFSFKQTLNKHLADKGVNVTRLWSGIHETIRTIYEEKRSMMVASASKYRSSRNFFEMVRFDFVVDDKAHVYLMEVNMSPNLSTGHFSTNRLLYEHVIFNVLRLVGIASMIENPFRNMSRAEEEMQVSVREISVFPEWCTSTECNDGCNSMRCMVCIHCLSKSDHHDYMSAYLEHVNRGSCRRMLPPSLSHHNALIWTPETDKYNLNKLTLRNRKMFLWFLGMCRKDVTFCI